jgi:hypothetical protein
MSWNDYNQDKEFIKPRLIVVEKSVSDLIRGMSVIEKNKETEQRLIKTLLKSLENIEVYYDLLDEIRDGEL